MTDMLSELGSRGVRDELTAGIRQGLQQLDVTTEDPVTHADVTVIRGVARSLTDRGVLPAAGALPIEAPGLTSGLRFQFAYRAAADGSLSEWALDLDLDRIAITVPGLRPAKESHEPARATRLVEDTDRRDVRLVGRGVLRIGKAPGHDVDVSLIDRLDDTTPFGAHGALVGLTFAPPSFFIGGSSLGMTVDEIVYDDSETASPPRKDGPWRGLAIRRATLFLPPGAPLLGDISLGVYDIYLGNPVGIEGTAFLEFGGAADTPTALTVAQFYDGSWHDLAVTPAGDASMRADQVTVALHGSVPPAARLRATLANPGGTVAWHLPHGADDPADFTALPGDSLQARVGDNAPTTLTFTGDWTPGPDVSATVGGTTFDAVASVTGTAADLAGLTFAHGPGDGSYSWQWDETPPTDTAVTTVPTVAGVAQVGAYDLTLRDGDHVVRRVRVEIRAVSPIVIGHRGGVSGPGGAITAVDVVGTYALGTWIASGTTTRAQPEADLDGAGQPQVGTGELAEVTTAATVTGAGTTSTSSDTTRRATTNGHVQFSFAAAERRPAGAFWRADIQGTDADLAQWIADLAGAHFAVVGRCDDLSHWPGVARTDLIDPHNAALADDRAVAMRSLLIANGAPETSISYRGEQTSGWSGSGPTPPAGSVPDEALEVAWRARIDHADYVSWRDSDTAADDDPRPGLRRADVYAFDVPAAAPSTTTTDEDDTHSPTRVRALVPGPDPTHTDAPTTPTSPRGRPQFRVRIEVQWQDPSAPDLGHATPMRAEAIVQWPGSSVTLPASHDGHSQSATLTSPPGTPATTTPVWTIRGRWTHDRATGADDFLLALDVAGRPDGIVAITSPVLAASAGLAPAVIGATHDPGGGDAVAVAALIAVLGVVGSMLLQDTSRTVITGITIDHLRRHDTGDTSRTLLTVDYTVELAVDVSRLGFPIEISTKPGHPMKLHYAGVGLEIDTSAPHWYDGVRLHASGVVPTVVDPGSWTVGPPLGDLLHILGINTGAGSSWLEVTLGLALDLGVVTLDQATVRIVFGEGGVQGVELRGLRAGAAIPGVLRGEGELEVSDGRIDAAIGLEIIPVHVAAVAALSIGQNGFVSLMVGVRFPAAIPFANSGLGLYGLVGRFVTNGARDVDHQSPDVLGRELDWLAKSPTTKYAPQEGQYALGLGAIIGTSPDMGSTFNALGMIVVEFPEPEVIFAIIARVLSGELVPPTDQAVRPESGLSIIGLVVINEEAVTVAVQGHYEIPQTLVLDIPIGAYFPLATPERSWLHVGTDNQPGREGAPVTLTLLPGVLDVRVWAFMMVHGAGLNPGLQGRDDFVFDGFAIGFGAGWEINWSAGPIRLTASATLLAGFGTRPFHLAAGIWVRGELDLVIVSVSARGEIELQTDGHHTSLHGEFCGSVDCFFFSVEGCVSIDVTGTPAALPDPDCPVTGLDLVSRKGYAVPPGPDGSPPAVPVVWPDTVPVLHFAHLVENAVVDGQFAVGTPLPGPVWSGSRDVKHAFRLDAVEIVPEGGPAFVPPAGTRFDTAWWWPGIRSSTAPPLLSATGSEARDLALLAWEAWLGQLPLTDPDHAPGGGPGGMVGGLCDPVATAAPVCTVGALGRAAGVGAALLPQDPAGEHAPATVRITQPVGRNWAELQTLAAATGDVVLAAARRPLAHPVTLVTGPARTSGWRLAGLGRGGQELGSLGAAAVLDPPLESVSLSVELCPVPVHTKTSPPPLPDGCVELGALGPDEFKQRLSDAGHTLAYASVTFHADDATLDQNDVDGDGRGELVIPPGGLRVELPAPVDHVTVRLAATAEWEVVAFDGSGQIVAHARGNGPPADAELTGKGIVTLKVTAVERAGIVEVCGVGPDPYGPLTALFAADPARDRTHAVPAVVGVRTDGSEAAWPATKSTVTRCTTIVYKAPDPGPWAGWRIADAPELRVSVAGCCGTRWDDAHVAAQAEQHRVETVGAFARHATGAAGTVRGHVAPGPDGHLDLPIVLGPPPRPLLPAGTTFNVTVRWSWQRWQRSDASPDPGDPASGSWTTGADATFSFRTAALTAVPTPTPPTDLVGEEIFEPRQIARYVTGATPSGGLPHLLDDPIRVFLSVDHLPALLAEYGYTARVEVHPTDVPAGSQTPENPHPPDVASAADVLSWRADGTLLPVELAVAAAADAAPCLAPTSGSGTAIDVEAALQPETGYDLTLVAHPGPTVVDPGPDVVAARWHLRTSRYRDVGDIVLALGLQPGAGAPYAPPDLVVPAAPVWSQKPFDDAALEAALAALGLDPLPLSSEPRLTLLWLAPDEAAPAWRIAGALLEAPEPIARAGRITASATLGAAACAHVAGTASGTRVLLAPATAVAPAIDTVLTVTLADAVRGLTASGSTATFDLPRSIRTEVIS